MRSLYNLLALSPNVLTAVRGGGSHALSEALIQ